MYNDETVAIRASFPAATKVDFLGEGACGVAFCITEPSGRTALKLLKPTFDLARSNREIHSLSLIKSPNVVSYIDDGTMSVAGTHRRYFRTEYVDGYTLESTIAQGRQLLEPDLLDLAIQLTKGLNALGLRQIVHRDLKPGNVMVDSTGRAIILDLGLASCAGSNRLTVSGLFLGSAFYASPEQIRSAATVDIRADIFSLGVILFEAASGPLAHPFGCKPTMTLPEIYALLRSRSPRPHPIASFRAIVAKMLKVAPYQRYASPAALLNDLSKLQ